MKITAVLLLTACLHASAGGYSQDVTLKVQRLSVRETLNRLQHQTGYFFAYAEEVMKNTGEISIDVKAVPLTTVLDLILKGSDLTYKFEGKIVTIRKKTARPLLIVNGVVITEPTPITGVVLNADQQPIPGVNVFIKGSTKGTITDNEGRFTLNVRPGDVLIISSVEFISKEIKINNGESIKVLLIRKINDLNEQVIVAYGSTRAKENTAAITTVKGENLKMLPVTSFEKALQGQVPGLLITSGSGQPGGGSSNILLRGIATAIGGSARLPLFVIDGLPIVNDMTQRSIPLGSTAVTNPLAQINMNDIESYTVLKDAAAIALYGSKASNGVVLLTTKKGKAGKTTVNFRQQVDVASFIKNRRPDVLGKNDYLALLRESYKNANAALWTDAAIETELYRKFPVIVKTPGDTVFYDMQDWNGALNNPSALTSTTDLSISGGNDRTTFYLDLNYFDQTGIVKASGYKRASVRYNFSNKVSNWFTMGLNSSFSFNKQEAPSTGESATGPFGFQYSVPAVYPVYLQDGSYYLPVLNTNQYNLSNPAAALQWNVNRSTYYRAMGNVYAEINFLQNFRFKTDFAGDFMLSQDKTKTDLRLPSSTLQGIGEVSVFDRVRTRLNIANTLRFNKNFGHHGLGFVLGQEAQSIYTNSTAATSRGFTSPIFEEVSAGSTIIGGAFGTSGSSAKETLLSFFAQANYNYLGRYFLSASARRDGSSKFGDNHRYGNYWSLGAGWVISDEHFMQPLAGWLDYLKLRGSIGTAGNSSALSATARYYLLTLGGNYDGAVAATLAFTPGNSNIKWETQFSKDLGIEARFFKERIGFSIDLYHRLNSDLIYLVDLPSNTGYSFGYDNIGDMSNRGIEIALNADVVRSKKTRWTINANWSSNKNKLEKAYQDGRVSLNMVQKVGEPFNSMYLVRWAGVNPDNGKPLWYDLDGKTTETYSLDNRVIVGQIQPKGFGGITNTFSYGGWQLSALLYYQYGNVLYNDAESALLNDGASNPYYNQSIDALDRWQKAGDKATNPRRVLNNPDGGNRTSTRYLSKGDFMRLKNVSVSYNFSAVTFRSMRINNIRIYAQGNNLALWTKYNGIDPESATSEANTAYPYPQVKTFSFGVDLSF